MFWVHWVLLERVVVVSFGWKVSVGLVGARGNFFLGRYLLSIKLLFSTNKNVDRTYYTLVTLEI